MPLPPAPTRRAALLAPEAYNVVATASTATKARKAPNDSETTKAPLAAARKSSAAKSRRSSSASAPASMPAAAPMAKPNNAPTTDITVASAPVSTTTSTTSTTKTTSTSTGKATERSRKKGHGTGPAKLFVLDTNVLLHDPTSLFRFEEHDIYLPMIVLEELDAHK